MRRPQITVITTGGTIDKDYGVGKGVRDLHIGPPFAKRFFQETFPETSFKFVEVCRKDSLDLTAQDRKLIVKACRAAKTQRIIITHGTDTMLPTAECIDRSGVTRDHGIVMTGALRPASMQDSDAKSNLILAIAATIALERGIMIALNNRIHWWNECKKDSTTGEFVSTTKAA